MDCFRQEYTHHLPFLKLTVPEWIENRIKGGEVGGLRSALFVLPDDPRLLATWAQLSLRKRSLPTLTPTKPAVLAAKPIF